MTRVTEAFATDRLISLAGPAVVARGVGYEQRVAAVTHGDDDTVTATVRGTVPYTVRLWVDHDQAQWSCTCPYAEHGECCKHVVAVAMTLHPSDDPLGLTGPLPGRRDEADEAADQRLVDHVAALPRPELEALVMEAADLDWRLRSRLLADASAVAGEGPDLHTWRNRIDVTWAPDGDLVYWDDMADWTAGLDDVVDALGDLLEAGHAGAVVNLAEYAWQQTERALAYVDDSDGGLSIVAERIATLHRDACHEAELDPIALAGRLVDLELGSELDGFHRAAATYSDVLGPTGLAAYRDAVAPRWDALGPDDRGFSSERYGLREALLGVALATGDVDAVVDIRSRDLRTPGAYLEISRVLAAAGRDDEAMQWARDGLDRFADREWQVRELRDHLAGLLRDRGNGDDAVELYWDGFARNPSMSAYHRLHEVDDRDRTEIADRAVSLLRDRLEASGGKADVLVSVLAHEGRVEEAWEAAQQHGCEDQLRLAVARAREDDHPVDAIDVYEPEVERQIQQMKNHTYRQAVDLMARIHDLSERAGQPERFTNLLTRVRDEHGRKRNLMKLVRGRGW